MRQVILHPDHEAGGWVAESKPDALRNARDAIRSWLDAAVADIAMNFPGTPTAERATALAAELAS